MSCLKHVFTSWIISDFVLFNKVRVDQGTRYWQRGQIKLEPTENPAMQRTLLFVSLHKLPFSYFCLQIFSLKYAVNNPFRNSVPKRMN